MLGPRLWETQGGLDFGLDLGRELPGGHRGVWETKAGDSRFQLREGAD